MASDISIIQISENNQDWTSWLPEDAIFNQPAFLSALETSESACTKSGWQPQHLGLYINDTLTSVLPLYIKNHSYGEYMFDWQWANGLHRAGIEYYPKAVSCVPFTPVTGPRLMSQKQDSQQQSRIIEYIKSLEVSNFQCLYVSEEEAKLWQSAGAMIRRGYQFSWYNHNYTSFDDFLAQLRSSYRKKIRRERKQIAQSKLTFKRYYGKEITDEVWEFFIICYKRTYLKRSGHEGYLNQHFFELLRQSIGENLMVVMACYQDDPVASSLCFVSGDTLYGRYWGTIHDIDGLHFEVCYYQGIEFCIERGLNCYHPGTQGDYKRRRGFIPEYTFGAYYFNIPNISSAIEEYLYQEYRQLQRQMADWQESSPYKEVNQSSG